MIGMSARSGEALLQVEAVEVRKRHVEHEAARRKGARARQERLRGREGLGLASLRCGSALRAPRAPRRHRRRRKRWALRAPRTTISRSFAARIYRSVSAAVQDAAAQRARSAASSASRNAVSLNGLTRHPRRPARSGADGRLVAVRRDEDDRNVRAARSISSRCRSGPLMPGMATSRIRHCVWPMRSDARNSSADANVCDRKAELPQQVGQRLAHGFVVIDHRNEWAAGHHAFLVRSCAPLVGRVQMAPACRRPRHS